ncbi:BppU family phage baseplate upper protein [Lactobacillus kitasatonis]|uniref:BppU family phage baseplate upper protein n=1 Tax=Lactobacillus kitasatonis TaxID=237446 RepID=UPI003F66AA6A
MAVLTPPSFHNINLDLVKMQAWAPQQIYATAGDTGYAQVFSLYMNGDPYTDASPETLNFRAIKPDNNVVDIKNGQGFQAMSGSSNKFVFTIPEQVFAATGRVECYFYITTTDGKMVASTTHFFYEVQRAMPSETGSISMIATLDDVVKQAHDLYAQAMSTMSEITATKTDTDKQATNFAVDLKQKQSDAEKQADQMLADVKAAMDKTAGDATDYQTKLDDLNKQYITKYNELLAQLPDANDAVQKKIGDALAQLKVDEQQKFQEIEMDWVKQKETLSTAITTYENSVTKQLDDLKQQISGISSEKVTKLSSDIDALQQKLASLKLSDYYTKKEIDDKLDSFQPKIDLSGYETTTHAEDTYAKKTDIVAPNLSGYETTAHASETYETKADAASHLTKTQADAAYASKSDIPDVSCFETKTDADATYAKKADIPASPDLSGYETVAHADETFAKKSDIVSPDLTDYAKSADVAKTYETKADAQTHLTKTQADADYATKADLANVKPDMSGYVKTTDLTGYAKKSDVSPIKTIHVLPNGWPEDQPGNKLEPDKDGNIKIDLSQYVYESEFRSALPDMSYYLSKSDAEANYAKKSDIPNLSKYLTKTDADADYLAKSYAANFATKDDVKNVAGVKSVTINDGSGSEINVPISRDGALDLNLSSYQQKPSSSYYITKDDADATYAKKGESTGGGSVDLTDYLKKDDADKTYAKKTESVSYVKVMTNNITTDSFYDATHNKYVQIPVAYSETRKPNQYQNYSIDLTSSVFRSIINTNQGFGLQYSAEEIKNASATNDTMFYNKNHELYALGHRFLTDDDAKTFATKDDLKNIGSGSSSSSVKTINIESPNVSDPTAIDVWGTITIKPDSSGTVNVDRDTLYNAIFNHHSPVTSITVKNSNGNNLTVDPDSVTGELQLDLSNYLTLSDANNTYAKTDDILQTTNKRYFGYCETSSEQDAIDQSNGQYPTITYFNGYIYIKGHKIKVEN